MLSQRPHIDAEIAERAPLVAVIDPAVALAEQAVEAIADDAVAVDRAAEIECAVPMLSLL